jgi:crotonobetainyl-CoA:carnitine CoA-transferase CaiB-like acyl-CoA transferase
MSAMRGIKVLELAESVSGEYCGKLLSDFGAEVIKLEPPGGSPTRRRGPFAAKGDEGECSGLFAYLNTNKRSVALDISSVAGAAALQKLLDHVDVVIDDHASGWLKSVGLDPETLDARRPKLVLCSITPFGQSPPDDRLHAEDLTVFHSSGLGYHTPSGSTDDVPPLKGAGRFLTSYEAALDAALCISASLYEREASGLGRFIDISKQQVLASRLDYVLGQMIAGDMDVSTNRTQFDLFGPAGIFRCRDGFAYIWMSAPSHWDGLRKLLGNPEWMNTFPERWLERECTPERVKLCRQHIAEWLATQEKEKVAAEAQKLGLILVAVNNAEDLKASPQYAFRKFFAEVQHPVLGTVLHPTVPYKLSATPAQITMPAPLLGQHNALIGEQS